MNEPDRQPKKQKASVEERIKGDLDRGDLALARRRLESRLQIETNTDTANVLRAHLIEVLVQMGDPERAGLFALLVEEDTAQLNDLRSLFIRRCGGSGQAVKDRLGTFRKAVGPKAKDRLDQLSIELLPFKIHPEKWRRININESKGTFIFLGLMLILVFVGLKSCGQ